MNTVFDTIVEFLVVVLANGKTVEINKGDIIEFYIQQDGFANYMCVYEIKKEIGKPYHVFTGRMKQPQKEGIPFRTIKGVRFGGTFAKEYQITNVFKRGQDIDQKALAEKLERETEQWLNSQS